MGWREYAPEPKRIPADMALTSGISAAVSALMTWWASVQENAPELTSVGWLAVFVSLAFAFVLLFALIFALVVWARNRWFSTETGPTSEAQQQAQSLSTTSTTQSDLPRASIVLKGLLAGEPVKTVPNKPRVDGLPQRVDGEDVIIELRANEKIDVTGVRFEVFDFRGNPMAVHDLNGDFSGVVGKGYTSRPISIASVHYFRTHARVEPGPGIPEGMTIPYRHDLRAVVFEGSQDERNVELNGSYQIVAKIWTADGSDPITAQFNWVIGQGEHCRAKVRSFEGAIEVDPRMRLVR